jgi:hypothetical protein
LEDEDVQWLSSRVEAVLIYRMASSGLLRRVALVSTDVSEEFSASRLAARGEEISACSVRRFLVTASVVPRSPILVVLMKEALTSSGTSVLTRATGLNITEDGIFHSHRLENHKPDIALTGWTL